MPYQESCTTMTSCCMDLHSRSMILKGLHWQDFEGSALQFCTIVTKPDLQLPP